MSKTSSAFGPLRAHKVVDVSELGRKQKRRRRKKKRDPEAKIQKAWVIWARSRGLEVQHQNNGAKAVARKIHLAEMGCANGAADILVLDRLPDHPFVRCLAIEFKAPGGVQSAAQKKWQARVERLGWRYHLAWSKAEAIDICQSYGLGLD